MVAEGLGAARAAALEREMMSKKSELPGGYAAQSAAGYECLGRVLQAAHDQSAYGKGKIRHANARPFERQPIMEIGRMVGPGYQTGQAMKKAQEAGGMLARGEADAARAELLGAIVYLSAAVLLIEERMAQAVRAA